MGSLLPLCSSDAALHTLLADATRSVSHRLHISQDAIYDRFMWLDDTNRQNFFSFAAIPKSTLGRIQLIYPLTDVAPQGTASGSPCDLSCSPRHSTTQVPKIKTAAIHEQHNQLLDCQMWPALPTLPPDISP